LSPRVFFLLLALLCSPLLALPPLPNAHSHNDYEQKRPLIEALEHGFHSVEADIHLVDGQLLVAHDRDKTRAGRTLESLYLAPLRERCRTNGGRVHPGLPGFTLLIDIKSDAAATYAVLDPLLRKHRDLLTRFTPTNTTPGAITVILSGSRPTAVVAAQSERFCAIDGRPPDLDANPSIHLVPLISDSWTSHFSRPVEGRLSDADRLKLSRLVRRTHEQGRRIRFWAAPDRDWAWAECRDAGVDLINTDRIPHLAAFLRGLPPPPISVPEEP
jgi:hypothetical protein